MKKLSLLIVIGISTINSTIYPSYFNPLNWFRTNNSTATASTTTPPVNPITTEKSSPKLFIKQSLQPLSDSLPVDYDQPIYQDKYGQYSNIPTIGAIEWEINTDPMSLGDGVEFAGQSKGKRLTKENIDNYYNLSASNQSSPKGLLIESFGSTPTGSFNKNSSFQGNNSGLSSAGTMKARHDDYTPEEFDFMQNNMEVRSRANSTSSQGSNESIIISDDNNGYPQLPQASITEDQFDAAISKLNPNEALPVLLAQQRIKNPKIYSVTTTDPMLLNQHETSYTKYYQKEDK